MRIYRAIWLFCWGAVLVVGVSLGFQGWSASAGIGVFNLAALLTAGATVAYYRREGMPPVTTANLVVIAGTRAVVAGLVVLAVSIAASALGALVWLVLLLSAATSPWALALVNRRRTRLRQQPPEQNRAVPPPAQQDAVDLELVPASAWAPAVQTLSDNELCLAWRASFTVLQSAESPAARGQLVTLRQAYLDDIERRDPVALDAWLTSGARAAGDPARYLTRRQGQRPHP